MRLFWKNNGFTLAALIIQAAVQILAIGYYVGKADARLAAVETRLIALQTQVDTLDARLWQHMAATTHAGLSTMGSGRGLDAPQEVDIIRTNSTLFHDWAIFMVSSQTMPPAIPDLPRYFFWRSATRQYGPLISRAEAARLLGVTPQTIANRVNAFKLTSIPLPGDTPEQGLIPLAEVFQQLEDSLNPAQAAYSRNALIDQNLRFLEHRTSDNV